MIHFICATPWDAGEFMRRSTLYQYVDMLDRLRRGTVQSHVFHENTKGLGAVYNGAIDFFAQEIETDPGKILVFLHHDVQVDDINLPAKLMQSKFDIIGLAGAVQLHRVSPILWHHIPAHSGDTPQKNWSGAVAHRGPNGDVWQTPFGIFGKSCEVIDGLFIAVKLKRLIETGVRFDEQFDFHFYDLDFCLTAREAGLTIGTEAVWVIHEGLGEWDVPEWHANEERFMKKWGA
jgi:hypothetical protein